MNTSVTGFSIIVPTFCEVMNIPLLVKRIAQTDFGGRVFEVILMDDNSQDGTESLVSRIREQYPWLKLVIRHQNRDLGQSVIEGFQRAIFPVLVTMDADLSHPPESIPLMLASLEMDQTDLVIGSRYIKGGSTDTVWPVTRKFISLSAALLTRVLFRIRAKDPLSGFLAFRKNLLARGNIIELVGWKVGLELIIKCRCKHIREIPVHFSQRHSGKSKLNLTVAVDYFRHLYRLLCY